jgi:hypothetical protein
MTDQTPIFSYSGVYRDSRFDVKFERTPPPRRILFVVLAAGFDYIAEKNDIMLFRRSKRFNG